MSRREGPAVGEAPGESLPRTHRLRKRGEIRRVQEGGVRYAAGGLLLMVRPNTLGRRRLGVTVSSKVGNSVTRSKIKRWFREIFRRHRALLPPSVDVVLIARGQAARSTQAQLLEEFQRQAAKALGAGGRVEKQGAR